ncbi:MAG: AMP-binding protein, partial [Rubrivivax sp.]
MSAFETLADRLRHLARQQPQAPALGDGQCLLSYRNLDRLVDRVAAALQRDGVRPGQAVASCAAPGVLQAVCGLGTLRAGAVAAPIAPSVTPAQFSAMVADAGATFIFVDGQAAPLLPALPPGVQPIDLGGAGRGTRLDDWMAQEGVAPRPVLISPSDPFNIIYSSGTTGTPKGIVQPHAMRWAH